MLHNYNNNNTIKMQQFIRKYCYFMEIVYKFEKKSKIETKKYKMIYTLFLIEIINHRNYISKP